MPALPPVAELPRWIREHSMSHRIISAYNICLGLESWVQYEAGFHRKEKDKALIQCRILGYLFHHFPSDDMGSFVRAIVTADGKNANGRNEALLDLGEYYYVYFVKLFMSNKGHTPAPSSHPSRRSVDDLVAKIKDELKDAPQNHQTAKKKALIRDGFKCVVTKVYDRRTAEENQGMGLAVINGMRSAPTECAHIFPESINSGVTPGSKKEDYAATIWAVLELFGHRNLKERLNGANIHRLDNVMTLERSVHDDFDRLKIYFTATEVPHKYKFEAVREFFLAERPGYVTFSTPDAEQYPLPNPTYLAIHAACAKVAHLSGAAEHIEEILRRMEDTRVLAEDGRSSDVLYTAILSSMRAVAV
ncbi:hypothetical protein BKA83DRAFT_4333821 [Pisolithus microcarpus]|nr:hypothetical protein BKA83DRAFT_4333821 [Pisolithus microcarpus]